MAEGPVDQINRLKQEIDDYLGIPAEMFKERESATATAAAEQD